MHFTIRRVRKGEAAETAAFLCRYIYGEEDRQWSLILQWIR